MPQPTSVSLVPVHSFRALEVGELIIFRKRICQICQLLPKEEAKLDPTSDSVRLEVIWGKPDDAPTGWRALNTLVKEGAFKLIIQ